jgi:hypothetical protein
MSDSGHVTGAEPPLSELTSVMLDMGGGFGALVVHAGADDAERQLEVADERGRRTHAVVHRLAGGSYEAVFPSLRQGSYVLLDQAGPTMNSFTVAGGEVSFVELSPPAESG